MSRAEEEKYEMEPALGPPSEDAQNKKKKSFWTIDKDMVRFKIHYFLFFGAMGAIVPFLPLIAKDRVRISAASFAVVLTTQLFFTAFFKTAMGYVADYFQRMKILLSALIIFHFISYFALLSVPPITETQALASNSVFSDNLKNYQNDTQIGVISMRSGMCKDHDASILNGSGDEATTVSVNIQSELERQKYFLCFIQPNTSETTFCYVMGAGTETELFLGKQQTLCCSKYTTTMGQVISGTSMMKNNVFHLSSLTPPVSNERVNKTFQCVANFTKSASYNAKSGTVYEFDTYQFWLFLVIFTLGGAACGSVFSLSDTTCFESVLKFNSDFGRQRIFSALSWGLFAPVAGLLCDLTNEFYSTAVLLTIIECFTLWNLYKMDIVVPKFSHSLAKDVCAVLNSKTYLAFLFGVFVSGVYHGITLYYLIWFVSSLGASTFLCGLVPYVQCVIGELPFMFFSGWFIEKLGHFNLISLALLSYAIRFLWYSYLYNPWLVLPLEITHGFTYGTFYPTMASFGNLSAKPGTEATTQSILYSMHEALGCGLGCVLAGIGFDRFGGHWTFFYFSLFAFGSTIINICSTFFIGRNFMKAISQNHSSKR